MTIRVYQTSDLDSIINIWNNASVQAHDFVDPLFWEERQHDMRNVYIPHSETYVLEQAEELIGFLSLVDEKLAALFVDPTKQQRGHGQALLDFAKTIRDHIELNVYKQNSAAVSFYIKNGFAIKEELIDAQTQQLEYLMEWAQRN
ncbi:acetyltransferase [Bacillus sp. JCM 19046]|nr:acetyltransferase [Bacillus sp. JCM 19045]GAF18232.1 acetyltransferase [Bacillus sp. JCM 19046]